MVQALAPMGVPYAEARTALQQYRSLLNLMTTANVIANDASSLDNALQQAVDAIAWHIGWPVCHVYLRSDRPADELAPSPIWHLATPERHERFRWTTEITRFRPGLGLVGYVQATGRPVWAADVTTDHRFIRRRDGDDLGVRAGILFPMLVGHDVVGVLECFSPRIIDPDPTLLEALANVGMTLGRVLERAHRPGGLHAIDGATQLQRVRHEAASALVSSIAHEINNPLYAARSAVELLKSDLTAAPPGVLAIVSDELARIAHVMGGLETFAPMQRLRSEPTDLRALLDGAIAESLLRTHTPRINVRLTITSLRPRPQFIGDRALLQQALGQIFANAADAMPDGGTLRIHALAEHDAIEIAIADTGAGLPPAAASRMFEPFFTTKPGRSGLGLTICAQIVAQHGGHITAETIERHGTTIRMKLPRTAPASE